MSNKKKNSKNPDVSNYEKANSTDISSALEVSHDVQKEDELELEENTEMTEEKVDLFFEICHLYLEACDCFYHPDDAKNALKMKDIICRRESVVDKIKKGNYVMYVGSVQFNLRSCDGSVKYLVDKIERLSRSNDGSPLKGIYNEDRSKFDEIWNLIKQASVVWDESLSGVEMVDLKEAVNTGREAFSEALTKFMEEKEKLKQGCCNGIRQIGEIEAKLFEIDATNMTKRYAHRFICIVHDFLVGELTKGI